MFLSKVAECKLFVGIRFNYIKTFKVGDEIRRNQNENVNISDYFRGNHWRVHPSWVYCRYHYQEAHEFDSSEHELLHFLALMSKPGWYWAEQYEAYTSADENIDEESNCGRQSFSHDDYYCNKELMNLLVFDAKATNNSFRGDYVEGLSVTARDLAKLYGIFIRFIATQSGLTRWHYLKTNERSAKDDDIVFGDFYKKAISEPWYKGAIFQNQLDPNSIFVYGMSSSLLYIMGIWNLLKYFKVALAVTCIISNNK